LRIGEHVDPPKDDARHRLNQLADSKLDEEESSVGPVCFAPRIRNEPFPAKFALLCDMPKYTRTVKPEDWLSDYVTAVDIAGGNKRTAVRYAPLMLTGSARTWLNPALQINSWHDFQEAFIKNFTGTYKRPPRPWQLALCKQRLDEPDRDYLTRWSELCNSCKGVGEEHAIGYFTDGCREGTLLKHKLHRAELKTMADFMAIADKYASADSAVRVHYVVPAPAKGRLIPHPARVDITTVIATARERMSIMITSMAPSKWPLFKEAQGLWVEARSAKETSSARTSTPSR
jgi:hypothetical protein